ncbi:MAG: hypothetical protein EAZ99_02155 [Alphaproteobacteria bacterium]|nr:MAG: hypothetical protein EAZ99_02155 [Alphaproteobacteria bacterium]
MPSLAPLPDGIVSLDWAKTETASFSVRISADGRIDYAWLDGIKSGSGKSTVDGVTLPKWLLGNIRDFLR